MKSRTWKPIQKFLGKPWILKTILFEPLRWRKPWKVDVVEPFREDVPFQMIDHVFAVMALCPQHIFQITTMFPQRMQEYINTPDRDETIGWLAHEYYERFGGNYKYVPALVTREGTISNVSLQPHEKAWPLPNVQIEIGVVDKT